MRGARSSVLYIFQYLTLVSTHFWTVVYQDTLRRFSQQTDNINALPDLSFFMQVRASVKRFCVCASMRGWLDGSAWNYRLYPWKRMRRLEILEAHKIY